MIKVHQSVGVVPIEQALFLRGGWLEKIKFPSGEWGQYARAFKAEDNQAGDLSSSWDRVSILPFPIWGSILQPPDWHAWCGSAETHHCLICCKMWKVFTEIKFSYTISNTGLHYMSHVKFFGILFSYMPSGSRALPVVSQPRTFRTTGTTTRIWPRSWDAIGVSRMMPLWIRCSPSGFTVMGLTLLDSTHLNCWLW